MFKLDEEASALQTAEDHDYGDANPNENFFKVDQTPQHSNSLT